MSNQHYILTSPLELRVIPVAFDPRTGTFQIIPSSNDTVQPTNIPMDNPYDNALGEIQANAEVIENASNERVYYQSETCLFQMRQAEYQNQCNKFNTEHVESNKEINTGISSNIDNGCSFINNNQVEDKHSHINATNNSTCLLIKKVKNASATKKLRDNQNKQMMVLVYQLTRIGYKVVVQMSQKKSWKYEDSIPLISILKIIRGNDVIFNQDYDSSMKGKITMRKIFCETAVEILKERGIKIEEEYKGNRKEIKISRINGQNINELYEFGIILYQSLVQQQQNTRNKVIEITPEMVQQLIQN